MLAQRASRGERETVYGGARSRRDTTSAVFWLLAAAAAVYLALPIVNLLVVEPWRDVPAALADPIALSAVVTSVTGATISTVVIAVFGVPLAYLLAHQRFRLRPLATFLVYVPLVFPAVVSGIVQLLIYGPYGPVGALAASRGFELDSSLVGVILAQTFVAAPFTIVASRAAFEAVDPATERVAETLGASRWRVFWTVSLPQASGGVLAGLILTWLRAMGEFGATAVLAYHPYTLPVYIYVQLTGLGVQAALPLALLALFASVIAIGAAMLATAHRQFAFRSSSAPEIRDERSLLPGARP